MMEKVKSIHFVGIKGVGMTPLAIIAKESGMEVSGSDIAEEFITDELLKKTGIIPMIGFSPSHLTSGSTKIDLVITTGAHGGFNNIEVLEARRKGIKVITQGEAVGVFMEGSIFGRKLIGISVTGTHGKTTTTAMVATILKGCGLDPSYVIGTGNILSLGSSGHFGKGEYLVAEADEYMTEPIFDKTIKFMWQHPKIAVITNIEFDHPDAYKSLDETRQKFLQFANQLPKNGVLITCGDDSQVNKLLSEFTGRKVTYGISSDNDFVVDEVLNSVNLSVFGDHNRLNATAAFIVGLEVGLAKEKIIKSLIEFKGSKRRSEFVGKLESGALVYDDYAHHPTEIKKTLKAFRGKFPNYKIVCVFQSHTYSRTKSLFDQFSSSFMDADIVILTKIYSSLREKPDPTVSMQDLANKIELNGKKSLFLPKLSDVVEYINNQRFGEGVIVITMGAGDVYKINEKLKIMEKIVIKGGRKLTGSIFVSGAKNVALKALVAACLTQEEVVIKDIPLISDFMVMVAIIRELGGEVKIEGHTAYVRMKKFKKEKISLGEAAKIRTSAMFLSPLLARVGKAVIPNPGGCRIGARPIDRTVKGLEKMGFEALYSSNDGYYYFKKDNKKDGFKKVIYRFEKSTHTGTETLIMAGVLGKGITILENAAREPEIDELIDLLTKMGAKIKKIGKRTIEITGVEKLHGTEFSIGPDRNEIATLAVAAILTKGDIFIKNVGNVELSAFIKKLEEANGGVEKKGKGIRFYYKGPLKSVDVQTSSYPGFMTDWQGPWAVLMTNAKGKAIIHETVYENRFGYVSELKKMGANIILFNPDVKNPEEVYSFNLSDNDPSYFHAIEVNGPTNLHNGVVEISDLRAGATLVLAALFAIGESTILGAEHLDRGYEKLEEGLESLGANIKRVKE